MSKITKITVGGTTYTVGPDSQSYVEASSWSSGSAISCSLSSDGCESVIYKNTGSSSITIPISTTNNVVIMDDNEELEIPAGGYAEINYLRITTSNTTRVFVRSIVL